MTRAPGERLTRENLTDRERQLAELCVHEAGHAVVGVVLGGRLRLASVTGGLAPGSAGFRGRTAFADLPSGHDAAVAYAGPWAAARWRADRRPTQRDVFAVLRGSGCADDAVLLASGAAAVTAARVVPLVERCWPQVCTLAAKIAADTTVRHADVCEVLALSADPPTAALQLAHIRAGAAPGSFTVTRPIAV